jgi:ribosomal protein S18 acetylase RimI-like enzyme
MKKLLFLLLSLISIASMKSMEVSSQKEFSAPQEEPYIADYNVKDHKKPIKDLFEENEYWLDPGGYFPIDRFLDDCLSVSFPQYKETIKVLCKKNVLIGFIAYYCELYHRGRINFLAIKESERGKGYGKMLLNYAKGELIKQNVKKITLVTRKDNISAQKIYLAAGFTQLNSNSTSNIVSFEYIAK